jgi:hypothetical protein
MLVLGTSDSGFESRRPDKKEKPHSFVWFFLFVGASTFLKKVRPGFEKPEYKIFSRKFFEAVPRPDFCDGKKLSRGRNSRSEKSVNFFQGFEEVEYIARSEASTIRNLYRPCNGRNSRRPLKNFRRKFLISLHP